MTVMGRCWLQPARTPRLRARSPKEQIRWVTDACSSDGTPVLQAKSSSRVYTVAAAVVLRLRLRLMAAIFDLRHAQTWNRIPSSLSVLSDPGNVGVAVGMSLLSCVRAEIYVIS